MDHRNVYAEYNVELVKQLKMKDPVFIAMLTKQRLFFGELKAKVREQSTEAEASSLFLHEVIERSLESNDPEPFMKLLSAMDEFGGPLEKLSAEMRKCLNFTTNTLNMLQSTDILDKCDERSRYEDVEESTPVEFSANDKMESAFGRLIMKFINELNRPPPYGQNLTEMKALCINYCDIHHHEKCDFDSSVSSMNDLFSKIAEPQYCNFLNLSLLKHLAECTDNECLKTSVKNYDNTFNNVQIKKELKNIGIGYKVKAIRSGLRSKLYEMMFIKLIRKGITYGQVKQIEVKICSRIIHIHPNSLIKKWYRQGSVCLGWLIPSCLVDAAYYSACTNTAVFGQLGIKYLIIGNNKIKPPLPINRAVSETPMRLFCKQYQCLVQKLQPVKVSVYMFAKGLLDKRDCMMIMNAPTDHIKNCMIIEHVRHQSSPYLFTFLDVLQQIEDQICIFDALISALASTGFLHLSDDSDIVLDEDEDDDHTDHLFHPHLHHYNNSCLKMNLSIKGKMQHLLTDHEKLNETKLPDMNIQYLYLIDDLCKLMESCDPGVFTYKCISLMASDIHNIPLFRDDKVVKDFGEYHNVSIMLRYLMCYFTWCDLSVIQKLLETCGYPDGVKLLKNFKHQIDSIRPFTDYPIPNPHSLMIPSDSSPYTVMVTQYELEHPSLSLRHVEEVKSLITESCEITPICCCFLAKAIDHHIFHWFIPKSVASLIASKVQENSCYLHKHGITDMSIFPSSKTFFMYNNQTFSLFYANPDTDKIDQEVDKVDPDVDITNQHGDKVDSDVDKLYLDVDKVVTHFDKDDTHVDIKTCQQEPDEIKLKYNVLLEENAELQSKLDIAEKNSKILVKKYRERKDREQHHTAEQTNDEPAVEQSDLEDPDSTEDEEPPVTVVNIKPLIGSHLSDPSLLDVPPEKQTNDEPAVEQSDLEESPIDHFRDHIEKLYETTRYKTEITLWKKLKPNYFVDNLLSCPKSYTRENDNLDVKNIQQDGNLSVNKDFLLRDTHRKGKKEHQEKTSLKDVGNQKYKRDYKKIKVADIFEKVNWSTDSPKLILIEGAPGMGKTTLCKEIAYKWCIKTMLNDIKLVLLIYLRDPRISQIKSLATLVHYFYRFDDAALELSEHCAKALLLMRKSCIMVILDGYDEFRSSTCPFIGEILNGEVLSGCRIVVTSRLTKSDELKEEADFRVEMCHFSDKEKIEYIKDELREYPEKKRKLLSYFKSHTSIKKICDLPIMMTILVYVFKQREELPNDSTELFDKFIALTISYHLQKQGKLKDVIVSIQYLPDEQKDYFNDLSKFAFLTLKENKHMFTKEDIEHLCPNSKLADLSNLEKFGLVLHANYLCMDKGDSQTFGFLHLSIQEYLSAYYITSIDQSKQFDELVVTFFNKSCKETWIKFIAIKSNDFLVFQSYLIYCKSTHHNPLTRKRQKTGVCVKCTELANARKLALIRMPFYKLCWYMHV